MTRGKAIHPRGVHDIVTQFDRLRLQKPIKSINLLDIQPSPKVERQMAIASRQLLLKYSQAWQRKKKFEKKVQEARQKMADTTEKNRRITLLRAQLQRMWWQNVKPVIGEVQDRPKPKRFANSVKLSY